MGCDEKYFLWMNRLLDGDLGAAERAELDAHLAGCSQCRKLYSLLSQMTEETAQLEVPAPPDLAEKVMEKVRTQRRRASRPARTMRWVVSMASAAAVLVTVIFAAKLFMAESPKDNKAEDLCVEAAMETEQEASGSGENSLDENMLQDYCAPPPAPAEKESPRKYEFQQVDYRYVVVLDTVPKMLEGRPYSQTATGERHYRVSNAMAESLMGDSLRHLDNKASNAASSLVIVENAN